MIEALGTTSARSLQVAVACSRDPCAGLACPAQWVTYAKNDGLSCSCECHPAWGMASTAIRGLREKPPPLLHQAWKTRSVEQMDPALVECYHSWRAVNPSLRQDVYDDADSDAFVRRHYPEWSSLYFDVLTRTVERMDVFRYLVVHKYGGWWADIDTFAKRPLAKLTGDLVVGREPQNNADGFGVLQYFFGATPRHPFFSDYLMPLVAKRAARRRNAGPVASVLWVTGPQAFTTAYKSWVYDQQVAAGRDVANARWDARVLPTCAMGAWCFDCERAGRRPYLEHRFLGSWKGGKNWTACPTETGRRQSAAVPG